MSALTKHVCHSGALDFYRPFFRAITNNNFFRRSLYNESALGLDSYLISRSKTVQQLGPMQEKFRDKMKEYLNSSSKNMVFTEDLRSMIHVIENTDDDLDLAHSMMVRFNNQDAKVRFGTYVFGPVIMRMYHHLNKPKEAFNALKSEELMSLFTQVSSYYIVMDLLYKTEHYQEVLEAITHLQENQTFVSRFPRECVVLAMGSCYKLNTKESLEFGLDLLKRARNAGSIVLRKALTFLIKLAIQQGEPEVALEIISSLTQQNYVTVRNLKILILSDLNRLEECLVILKGVIESDHLPSRFNTEEKVGEICSDVMVRIESAVEASNNQELIQQWKVYNEALKNGHHVIDKTLDDLLCETIIGRVSPKQENFNPQNRRNYNNENRRKYIHQGLADMD